MKNYVRLNKKLRAYIDLFWGLIAMFVLVGCCLQRTEAVIIGAMATMTWVVNTMIRRAFNALDTLRAPDDQENDD